MTLSAKTVNDLAAAMTDEVIKFVHEDERYAEFMMEVIPDAVRAKFGAMNDEVLTELSMCIMDRMCFRKFSM